VGTQEYELRHAEALKRFAEAYGEVAAEEISDHLQRSRD
jgi:hypothetical protein